MMMGRRSHAGGAFLDESLGSSGLLARREHMHALTNNGKTGIGVVRTVNDSVPHGVSSFSGKAMDGE
jgi:hypothetical protein